MSITRYTWTEAFAVQQAAREAGRPEPNFISLDRRRWEETDWISVADLVAAVEKGAT